MAQRIVIAGGSGFIGRSLAGHLLSRGYDVTVLGRSASTRIDGIRHVRWDGRTLGPWVDEINGAHAVVNLAGKNVNCRYTQRNLREIDQSRVNAVTVMAEAINSVAGRPSVLVQASTTAIYGDAGDRPCDESTPPGSDPQSAIPIATATQWERAFNQHPTPGVRRVLIRISFVLGKGGGALGTLEKLTRWFAGGAVGSGHQIISWIHHEDLDRIITQAIEDPTMEGIYIAAVPAAVTNADFMRELRRALSRPWSPPVPALMVRLGCFVMRTEPVLALTGRRAVPKRLLGHGFLFRHSDLREALEELYGKKLPAAQNSPPAA
ncbi:MAG TPA: TIGR01777 family oxidoreductase [Tepidisphaeraceae bacterium]|jgi:uncharacterized protein (TIGR01777 family)